MDQYLSFNQIWSKQARLTVLFPFFLISCHIVCKQMFHHIISNSKYRISFHISNNFLSFSFYANCNLKKLISTTSSGLIFRTFWNNTPRSLVTLQNNSLHTLVIFCTIKLVQISLSPDEDVVIH